MTTKLTYTDALNLLATMPARSKMEIVPGVIVKRYFSGFSFDDGRLYRAEEVAGKIVELLTMAKAGEACS